MAFLDYFRKVKRINNKVISICDQDTLPAFSDEELGLKWNRITSENLAENERFFEEMEGWSDSDSVKRYIASKVSLSELLRGCVSENSPHNKSKCNLYFCFNEDNNFVGVSYISSPLGKNNYSVLDYLIVNPRFQRQGVSTKMVRSISNNVRYFSNGYDCDGIMSSVESENIASSRAFERNGYRVIDSNISDTDRHYLVYYLNVKENNFDKGGMVG